MRGNSRLCRVVYKGSTEKKGGWGGGGGGGVRAKDRKSCSWRMDGWDPLIISYKQRYIELTLMLQSDQDFLLEKKTPPKEGAQQGKPQNGDG